MRVDLRVASAAMALLAMVSSAEAAPKPGRQLRPSPSSEHLYYNLSDKADELTLLALSDSGKQGRFIILDSIDVMRSPKMMIGTKWRIDCAAERMTIIEITVVEPGRPVEQKAVTTDPISFRAKPFNFETAKLACSGEGELAERRVYRGTLFEIAKRFWAD